MKSIVLGYLVSYLYLFVVMSASYAFYKVLKNSEISRKMVHIAAGTGWLILKEFFGAGIHSCIITATFAFLTIITYVFKVEFIERKDGSLGTIYYMGAMATGALISWHNSDLFDCWGIAMICLAFGDAAAGIVGIFQKNNTRKTAMGSFLCFIVSFLSVLIVTNIWNIHINIGACFFISATATVVEAYSEKYDNFLIPMIVMFFSYMVMKRMDIRQFLIAFALGSVMYVLCSRGEVLSRNASIILMFLISLVYLYVGIWGFLALLLVYAPIIVVDRLIYKWGYSNEKEVRSLKQLMPNCIPATLFAIFFGITHHDIFLVCFFSVIAESIADSMSSDVGVLSKTPPRDIFTFRPISAGLSGGISVLGTIAGMSVCFYSSIVFCVLFNSSERIYVVPIILSSFLGIIVDSVLGSRLQVKFICEKCGRVVEKTIHCGQETRKVSGINWIDNTMVNWMSNVFSGSICLPIVYFLERV